MKSIGVLLVLFVWGLIVACIASFCVMMGMNNVHEWWSVIPTMGFWQAFDITVWLAVPLAIYGGRSSVSSD